MKIGSAGGNVPAKTSTGSGRLKDGQKAGPFTTPAAGDATSIMGIPDAEFTPRVQAAISLLMSEAEELRHTVSDLSRRLELAEQLADLDSLLPVYNRRAFVRELTRVQASARRYGTEASLVYLDLDQFKAINDDLGHEAGDHVLGEVVKRLKDSVRETDIIGRLGGDEFGLILTRTRPEDAHHLLDRLRRQFTDNPIVWKGREISSRMSSGVVSIHAGLQPEETLSLADDAMYRHKNGESRPGA
ncbi:MAG: GGDEF domain-containing protein [Sneathiella sp.]|uniref:GGDEF domain-containing protein n=1 Tax=Sneathiella sp. TaxID=1964365 RepID=UPI000C4324F1|nr:GGDEF domain-containing protein [Sneathiella sp.]MAL78418.1 GGDEF domain-containing protein [Sneathiella sp.]